MRFGAELCPAYLEALEDADGDRVADLADVIEHYFVTGLEANIAIYDGDIDEEFRSAHLGTEASFPT